MRDTHCPICLQAGERFLDLEFGPKMELPLRVDLRYCQCDNFLFVGGGSQSAYDRYYNAVANDTYHNELGPADAASPIVKIQSSRLLAALGYFFDSPRNVLDFGCGQGDLVTFLASSFPTSRFTGFEPGPAGHIAIRKAEQLGLRNFAIVDTPDARAPYDLLIASHVVEHLVDLTILDLLEKLILPDGMLYIEVPDAESYDRYQRREFLYYFDRLHVNHFTPEALVNLMARYECRCVAYFEYGYPYRDGSEYPALGMLFQKGSHGVNVLSRNVLKNAKRYLQQEQDSAKQVSDTLKNFDGLLIWGTGDNFYRSLQHNGPLSELKRLALLDRREQEIMIAGETYRTIDPQTGIRRQPWPVVVTISEGRASLQAQIAEIDPERRVFFT